MFIGGFQETALGRVWVPDEFSADQVGMLPGIVIERAGPSLVLDTLDGWVHIYEECEIQQQTIDGFFSKVTRAVRKVFKKIASIPRKLHRATMKQLSKANERRKKITKSVLKNKYARQIVRVAGAVFAPFTGGLSLAAAEAAARYGKARYVEGRSRSSAFKRGAVGAVIGYAGGKAISYGYSAFQKGGVSALNPFATKAATSAVSTVPAGAAGGGIGGASSGGLWSTVGKTALKVGTSVGKAVATSYISAMAKGQKPGAEEIIYGMADQYLPPGYADAAYNAYGSYADAGAMEAAYSGDYGVSTVVPDGIYDEEGELITDPGFFQSVGFRKFAPLAIVAAGAIVGVSMLNKQKRGRKNVSRRSR
jgi:hypothetical protein